MNKIMNQELKNRYNEDKHSHSRWPYFPDYVMFSLEALARGENPNLTKFNLPQKSVDALMEARSHLQLISSHLGKVQYYCKCYAFKKIDLNKALAEALKVSSLITLVTNPWADYRDDINLEKLDTSEIPPLEFIGMYDQAEQICDGLLLLQSLANHEHYAIKPVKDLLQVLADGLSENIDLLLSLDAANIGVLAKETASEGADLITKRLEKNG